MVGMSLIYLDNNATTQPAPQVVSAMREAVEQLWGNPSSVHRFGQMIRQRVELARAATAGLIGARDREIIFTSGGTEADNLALAGSLAPGDRLITTPIEHSAIRAPAEALAKQGIEIVHLAIDGDGLVDIDALRATLQCADVDADDESSRARRSVLSIQWANNETGAIQPLDAVRDAVRSARQAGAKLLLHIDATQVVGKLPVDVKAVGADMLSFSAHKFHGPKGIGALFVRTGVRLRAQQLGGPQERDRRGGTENTPGILGMGVAAELARDFLADESRVAELRVLRDRFEAGVREALPETVVNAGGAPRLWNTSNLGFPRLEAEAILLGLSEKGVCASAGAACSSGSLDPSPVLLAMGVPEAVAHGSVRFSISRFTTAAEIDTALRIVPQVIARLAKTLPTPT